jgi:hypothetical protein
MKIREISSGNHPTMENPRNSFFPVFPTGRFFGRKNQKGLNINISGRTTVFSWLGLEEQVFCSWGRLKGTVRNRMLPKKFFVSDYYCLRNRACAELSVSINPTVIGPYIMSLVSAWLVYLGINFYLILIGRLCTGIAQHCASSRVRRGQRRRG